MTKLCLFLAYVLCVLFVHLSVYHFSRVGFDFFAINLMREEGDYFDASLLSIFLRQELLTHLSESGLGLKEHPVVLIGLLILVFFLFLSLLTAKVIFSVVVRLFFQRLDSYLFFLPKLPVSFDGLYFLPYLYLWKSLIAIFDMGTTKIRFLMISVFFYPLFLPPQNPLELEFFKFSFKKRLNDSL